jgi:tetratricopeptide (TPR) repeat protein
MKTASPFTHVVTVVAVCAAVTAWIAGMARGQQDDFAACTALQYDRLRTEREIQDTIGACTRVLAASSATSLQRAHAFYFRGLNHFLRASQLSIAERKPIGSPGEASQLEITSALDDLASCMAAAPQSFVEPFTLRATIYTVLKQDDRALADLEQAIRIDPKASVPHNQRGMILERLDRFAEARAEFDAAVALDPRNQNAWINRARLWTRYGDIDQAFSDYNQAEAVGGMQTWYALSGRARLALRLGEPLRAFADWTRAAELSPLPMLGAQFHVQAGNLARDHLKDPEKAQQSYARALAALPTYADVFIQRGIANERMSRFEEAASDYNKAIDLTRASPQDGAYARYLIENLRKRLSRKAGDPALPPNINVLSRSVETGAAKRRRVALVIGNAAYAHVTPLMNSVRDAESVGAALSEAGFATVTVATNLERKQLEALLEQFSAEAANADWALVYYAGHGIEVEGRNFIIPVDASLEALRNPASHAVAVNEVLGAVGQAKTLRLIALDACRDNPFVQEVHRVAARDRAAGKRTAAGAPAALAAPARDIGGGFAAQNIEGFNTLILYSTQPGQVALDGDELNSPFTRAFLKNIPVRGLDLRSFFERVREDVANLTQQRQLPAMNGTLREGESLFLLPI